MKWIMTAVVLSSSLCWGQAMYKISLVKAQPELAVPTIVAQNGVVYAAYRSFDLLHRSEQLQVASYDLISHKELRHTTISVPKVRGTRASEKLAVSRDGEMLAYVETGAPSLVLLISTKDLSEKRRLEALPYQEKPDRYEAGPSHFYGFDAENNLCFQSSTATEPRFVRANSSDLKVVSDTEASFLGKKIWTIMNWDTKTRRFWLENDEKQYQENGKPSGEELSTLITELNKGAYSLDNGGLLGFYAMVSKGAVVRYEAHRNQTLELPCSPSPYGISSNGEYAGAVCITQPGGLPEAGGDRVLTSEFLLIKSSGPTIVWREKLARLGAGDQGYYRWASSSIETDLEKTLVVTPMKSPDLAVYEIAIPQAK
jgi:hypothetical protein